MENIEKFLNIEERFAIPSIQHYIHRTKEREIADKIIEKGFEFRDRLINSTDDKIDSVESLYQFRKYGDYLIVIKIGRDICKMYLPSHSHFSFEHSLLCKKPDYDEEEDQEIYTLHNAFIKGWVNEKTGEIKLNKFYNPFYKEDSFNENFRKINTFYSDYLSLEEVLNMKL